MKLLAYKSKPAPGIDIDKALNDIFIRSRDYNSAHNIHGVLFFTGQCFMQVLEGPSEDLTSLLDRIRTDKRHTDITMLYDTTIDSYSLSDWNMEPLNLTACDFPLHSLQKTIEIVSSTLKLDAAAFIFLLTDLLNEPEFRRALNQ
ncbi:MAG: BLUF domain-containing protein [Reinekea sp.]|nr:BLUF domain-containing protein [Reinekea sp.]MDX1475153.1 BLUF domain-containing protein [Reinekea sp.]